MKIFLKRSTHQISFNSKMNRLGG